MAERIHPTPRFTLEEGGLICETICLGAKTVRESLVGGESTFHEPNLRMDYSVRAHWEGGAFVATRCCAMLNKGRPTVQRRWVDPASGQLVISQSWGGKADFVARYNKAR